MADASTSLLSRGSFGAATMLTGYLTYRCMVPPNVADRQSEDSKIRDTIATKPLLLISALYRNAFLAQTFWQGLVCFDTRFATTPLNPTPPVINGKYLEWNKTSIVFFAIIWTGAYVRLRAMRELGKHFTFELREPDKLKTDGLYKYVQHPSYSGGVPAVVGAAYFFLRGDGVLAGILPQSITRLQALWNWLIPTTVLLAALIGIPRRILEEEAMLKAKFGREWEEWHRRTARLVPFLL